MLKIVILVALLTVSVNGRKRECEAPRYFEALVTKFDFLTSRFSRGRFFYDAYTKRERIIGETQRNQTETLKDILVLWEQKKMYVLDLKTRKCNVSEPHGSFRKMEVGYDYDFVESFVIGSIPDEGVEMGVWIKHENSTYAQGLSIREFTRWHCLPFYESFDGQLCGERVHFYRSFANIVTQVIDPNVFEIPQECLK